jgi:hypothetical protein
MRALPIMLLMVLAVSVSGCILQGEDEDSNGTEINDITEEAENSTAGITQDIASVDCKNICNDMLSQGADLSSGPCLSGITDWNVADWACDVVHSPRQASDDVPVNQCASFVNGVAHHFVEVSTNCTMIRAV